MLPSGKPEGRPGGPVFDPHQHAVAHLFRMAGRRRRSVQCRNRRLPLGLKRRR
jgi:hypothetical protein